jgi:L-lactate dehydrogenase complex protein LldG
VAETGDRATFVGRLRSRLAAGAPPNVAHPMPPPVDRVPDVVHLAVDAGDLAGSFEQAATRADAVVHRIAAGALDDLLADVVERHGVRVAVCSGDPEVADAGDRLRGLGVDVAAFTPDAAAGADLGGTGAGAAGAATGSVVVDSARAGGRTASLLPRVHLCVVPAAGLVATPSDVLRPFTGHGHDLPANLVLISGPSRTGDIEQILTLGVHGPVALEIALLEA